MPDAAQKLSEMSTALVTAVVAAAIGIVTWFVRTVLTNNRRIDLLEQRQALQHEEMSSAVNAVRDAVHAIEKANETTIINQLEIARLVREIKSKRE